MSSPTSPSATSRVGFSGSTIRTRVEGKGRPSAPRAREEAKGEPRRTGEASVMP